MALSLAAFSQRKPLCRQRSKIANEDEDVEEEAMEEGGKPTHTLWLLLYPPRSSSSVSFAGENAVAWLSFAAFSQRKSLLPGKRSKTANEDDDDHEDD